VASPAQGAFVTRNNDSDVQPKLDESSVSFADSISGSPAQLLQADFSREEEGVVESSSYSDSSCDDKDNSRIDDEDGSAYESSSADGNGSELGVTVQGVANHDKHRPSAASCPLLSADEVFAMFEERFQATRDDVELGTWDFVDAMQFPTTSCTTNAAKSYTLGLATHAGRARPPMKYFVKRKQSF
jgi:hypothetical protein